jgi:hypothetical protein
MSKKKLNKIDRMIEGLTIIKKYEPDASFGAQHDVLYTGGDKWEEYTEEDRNRLEELGFFYDEDEDSLLIWI